MPPLPIRLYRRGGQGSLCRPFRAYARRKQRHFGVNRRLCKSRQGFDAQYKKLIFCGILLQEKVFSLKEILPNDDEMPECAAFRGHCFKALLRAMVSSRHAMAKPADGLRAFARFFSPFFKSAFFQLACN